MLIVVALCTKLARCGRKKRAGCGAPFLLPQVSLLARAETQLGNIAAD